MSRRDEPLLSAARALERDGWSGRSGDSAGVLRLDHGPLRLFLRASEHWAELALDVGRPRPGPVGAPALEFQALRLTLGSFLCKWAMEPGGGLVLRAELPLESLDVAHVLCAVGSLCAAAAEPLLSAPPWATFSEKPALGTGPELVSEHTMHGYLRMLNDKGWVYKERLATNHFRTLLISSERPFDVFVSFNEAWAYFQVPMISKPKVPVSPPTPWEGFLYEALLRWNDQMHWAKFGVDDEGQVVLGVDFPREALDFRRFRAAARTIEAYAAETSFEVQILARLDEDNALRTLLVGDDGTGHVPESSPVSVV